MPLTNTAISKAKPTDKPQRLFDGGGMYLEISPTGGKLWRLKYRYAGKKSGSRWESIPMYRSQRPEKGATKHGDCWRTVSTQAETTQKKRLRFLEGDVFPFIGNRPIAKLAAPDLLAIIHRIEGRGAMASTLLHELGLPHAVIETQLAHGERNKVSAAYNYAKYLPARKKMMQQWADYLDKVKVGAEVISLHGNAG